MVSSIGHAGYGMQQLMMMRPPNVQDFFKKVDSDGNGVISQDELKTLAAAIKNKSGATLNVDSTAIAAADSDGDGALNVAELQNFMTAAGFPPPQGIAGPTGDQAAAAYGANAGDDDLSTLITGLQQLVDKLQAAADGSTTAGGAAKPHGLFSKIDTDGSGTISKDELTAFAGELQKRTGQSITIDDATFAKYDSNGDGTLDKGELKSFMKDNGITHAHHRHGDESMEAAARVSSPGSAGDQGADNAGSASTQDTLAMLQNLLNQLSGYNAAKNNGNDSTLNMYS